VSSTKPHQLMFFREIIALNYEVTKVNLSLYRPREAPRAPEGWTPKIFRQRKHEGGKVVSPTHRPPYPQGKMPSTHFCEEAESTPRPHSAAGRINSMKNVKDPIGNQSRLVAQCLKNCATANPVNYESRVKFINTVCVKN
jgi:hypothetical protein